MVKWVKSNAYERMLLIMGEKNSSLTRVQPVVNALLDGWPDGEPWLLGLWELAALTRADALPLPSSLGPLLPAETPPKHERLRVVFERVIPPPARSSGGS